MNFLLIILPGASFKYSKRWCCIFKSSVLSSTCNLFLCSGPPGLEASSSLCLVQKPIRTVCRSGRWQRNNSGVGFPCLSCLLRSAGLFHKTNRKQKGKSQICITSLIVLVAYCYRAWVLFWWQMENNEHRPLDESLSPVGKIYLWREAVYRLSNEL